MACACGVIEEEFCGVLKNARLLTLPTQGGGHFMPYPDTAKTASLPKGAPYLKQGRSSVADIRFRYLTARCRLTRSVAVEGEVVLSVV